MVLQRALLASWTPLAKQLAGCSALLGAGELSAQLIMSRTAEQKGSAACLRDRFADVEWSQVAGFSCLAFFSAPAMHATAALGLNSCLLAPANISAGMCFGALIKGHSLEISLETSRAGFIPAMARFLCFWPPAQFVASRVVPSQLSVFALACAAYAWNTHFCWTMRRANAALRETGAVRAEEMPIVLSDLLPRVDGFVRQRARSLDKVRCWTCYK